MPPEDKENNQSLHPLQSRKLETMFASNPKVPQTPPLPQAMPMQPAPFAPQPRSKKKLIIGLIAAVSAVLIGAAVLVALLMSSSGQTGEFEKQASKVTNDLSMQVETARQGFKDAAQNHTFAETEAKIAEYQANLDETKSNIAKLKDTYNKLEGGDKSPDSKAKSDKAFKLADELIADYEEFLQFQQQSFETYTQLPAELTKYLDSYRQGGLRSDFVAQTGTVAGLAGETKTSLESLDAPPDMQPITDLRIDNLEHIVQTFTALKQYYESGNDAAVDPQLQIFSQENEQFNTTLTEAFAAYAGGSALAKKFEAFNKAYPPKPAAST